jgi:23S rRNA pseudouridine2605 synthase
VDGITAGMRGLRRVQVRLQKYLAEAGIGSRRSCEELITQGQVQVNGTPATKLGVRVDPARDHVTVKANPVKTEAKVYVALNKPNGVICTNHDTHGRKRVMDLLPSTLPRLYTVGRLDKDSEGLIFLTNDGSFSLRLTHPRYKITKTYLVEVAGAVKSTEISRLIKGVRSEGELLRAVKVTGVRQRGHNTEMQLMLAEGKKRQIRRMMAALGHPVTKLIRLAIGPVQLGDLKTSQWRYLTNEELCKLKHFSALA